MIALSMFDVAICTKRREFNGLPLLALAYQVNKEHCSLLDSDNGTPKVPSAQDLVTKTEGMNVHWNQDCLHSPAIAFSKC